MNDSTTAREESRLVSALRLNEGQLSVRYGGKVYGAADRLAQRGRVRIEPDVDASFRRVFLEAAS